MFNVPEGIPMKLAIATACVLSAGLAQAATAAEPISESCDQIRAQITNHTGIPAKPNTVLLGKVGANNKCRFTSAEVYRAAWGDKPAPADQGSGRRHKKHAEDHD